MNTKDDFIKVLEDNDISLSLTKEQITEVAELHQEQLKLCGVGVCSEQLVCGNCKGVKGIKANGVFIECNKCKGTGLTN